MEETEDLYIQPTLGGPSTLGEGLSTLRMGPVASIEPMASVTGDLDNGASGPGESNASAQVSLVMVVCVFNRVVLTSHRVDATANVLLRNSDATKGRIRRNGHDSNSATPRSLGDALPMTWPVPQLARGSRRGTGNKLITSAWSDGIIASRA